jgi:NADH dehydrogenase
MLTLDQVRLLRTDNIVSEEALKEDRTLSGLGIAARDIEAIVPAYLFRYRRAGQFTEAQLEKFPARRRSDQR